MLALQSNPSETLTPHETSSTSGCPEPTPFEVMLVVLFCVVTYFLIPPIPSLEVSMSEEDFDEPTSDCNHWTSDLTDTSNPCLSPKQLAHQHNYESLHHNR